MNIAFSILAILSGLYWAIKGVSYGLWVNHGPGGGVFPIIGGSLAVIFGVIYLIGEVKRKSVVAFQLKMAGPLLAILITIFASYMIGLIPALGLYIILWLKAVEKYPAVKSVCIGVGTGLFLFLVFDFWLKVPVPVGKIVEMLTAV